ncbi:MAG TPA: hypothetical protein VGF59_25810 [Bryobacteraceae bacterium]|jgi:hypothetical protein
MNAKSCPECCAILEEMRAASRAVKANHPGEDATPAELVAWLDKLDDEECARLRESSPFWRAWRRFMEHRTLTGHSPSFVGALPPGAITNPN